MKNLIIAALSTKIVIGMDFWVFPDKSDKVVCAAAMIIIFWVLIESLDEAITNLRRERRRKKRQAERFKLEVLDLTERKVM